jgi:hypothetical protein
VANDTHVTYYNGHRTHIFFNDNLIALGDTFLDVVSRYQHLHSDAGVYYGTRHYILLHLIVSGGENSHAIRDVLSGEGIFVYAPDGTAEGNRKYSAHVYVTGRSYSILGEDTFDWVVEMMMLDDKWDENYTDNGDTF